MSITPPSSRVVIVGGGIGGLALAAFLQQHTDTIDVTLYERDSDPSVRPQGTAIGLNNIGCAALGKILGRNPQKEHLLSSLLKDRFVPSFRFVDGFGRSLMDLLPNEEHSVYSVPRLQLRRLLQSQLKPNTIHFNHAFEKYSLNANNELSHLEFEVPGEVQKVVDCADRRTILIGADGTSSRVRNQLMQSPKSYVGMVQIGGLISAEAVAKVRHQFPLPLRSGDLSGMTLARNGCAFMMPVRDFQDDTQKEKERTSPTPSSPSKYLFTCTFLHPQADLPTLFQSDQSALKVKMASVAKEWHSPLIEIYQSIPEVKCRAFYDHNPEDLKAVQKADSSPVILIGDSAHSMTPFQGQGGNSALEDAATLGELLVTQNSSEFDMGKFVAEFYANMDSRVSPRVYKSRYAANLFCTNRYWKCVARDWGFYLLNGLMTATRWAKLTYKGK